MTDKIDKNRRQIQEFITIRLDVRIHSQLNRNEAIFIALSNSFMKFSYFSPKHHNLLYEIEFRKKKNETECETEILA